MRIAIALDGNKVSQHFGHCDGFELVDINNNEIKSRIFVQNPGHRPGFLPRFLAEKNVNLIIAGGMGQTAQELFNENDIEVITGADGSADDVIDNYINGTLKTTGEVCDHDYHGHCEE